MRFQADEKGTCSVIKTMALSICGQGLHSITAQVASVIDDCGMNSGLCTLFVQHTSCSLLIQEDYDPSAKDDLESWFNRLVPEGDRLYTHLAEGADDMPAHIKSALTASNLAIPFSNHKLMLGSWQGIFLWEHRHQNSNRKIIVHLTE